MSQNQSKKKFREKSKNPSVSGSYINECFEDYKSAFKVYRRDNIDTAKDYIKGLFKCEKGHANMERIEEDVDGSTYSAYQHFISNSKWDYQELIGSIALDASGLMEANKSNSKVSTGYIIDESAHLKKGTESVGVAKQYAGVVGKVENCQVGVYASLVNHNRATIVNQRLFLPEFWVNSLESCVKTGIPEESRNYKTKPQLALEMIRQDMSQGVLFDWVGGDGLYGHSSELINGLEELELLYVLDIHKDEKVFLEQPEIYIPKGRTKPMTDQESCRVDSYVKGLNHIDWTKTTVRKTTKGALRMKVHVVDVWVWNGKEEKPRKRTLVVTRTKEKRPKTKYSFSNGGADTYHPKEYAYFQAQRYWVERTFDDCKNELGMSDSQIRKWIGWHHHQSLVMMASLFLLKLKIKNGHGFPLISIRDARILVVVKIFGNEEQYRKKIEQMNKRHHKRQRDIDRYYIKQDKWESI